MSQLNKLYRNFIILQEDERGYSISNDKTLSGYSKIEAKGEKCKISFYAQNLRSDSDDYCVLAICSKKDAKQLVNLGKIAISDGGKAEVIKEYFLDDIGGIGLSFDRVTGAAIAKMRNDIPLIVMCGFVNGEQPTDNWKNYKVVKASNDKQRDKIEFIKKDKRNKEEIEDNLSERDHKKDKKDKDKSCSKNKEKNEDKMKMKEMHEKDKDDCNEDKMKEMHEKDKDDCNKDKMKMKEMHEKDKDHCNEDKIKMKDMHEKDKDNCNEYNMKMKEMHEKDKNQYKMNQMCEKEKKCCSDDKCEMNYMGRGQDNENPFSGSIYNRNPFGDYEGNERYSKKANKFDDYESKIEELSGNFKIRGSVGEYFEGIASGFEVLPSEYREIKNCKWYRVPVKDLDDLCNMTNYNRYTVAYYPMLNYYPYIRKHGYFNLGYKCDREGNLKYIVYGIPGNRSLDDQPYEGKTGFVTWVDKENRDGMGSWLMFYDFRNSTVVVPME
ncbi:hypothetical protein [Clostridium sp.]|uniref:hypothetical protein n=1 Tax=Clostridium sp. TaxID=1506 RepID=UPI002632765B|nr:hypothetical protein [Clostridium sp.]